MDEARSGARPSWRARAWAVCAREAQRPPFVMRLALLSLLLSSSCLGLGLYLDDYVGRYIYSDRPGAQHLFELYGGGYGLARGNPAELHWQIENGYAPWWAVQTLRLVLFRPIGVFFHHLDMNLPPLVQHAHSWLWLGMLVLGTGWMYRRLLGPTLGGAAALLFALDHTHGFIVGYICNRYALIAGFFGVLCLTLHVRAREQGRLPWGATLVFGMALLTSEGTVSLLGYLGAYALFVDGATRRQRLTTFAGYLVVAVVWRVGYTAAGFGAQGSGLYIDAAREPLRFLQELSKRGPVLVLGQFLLPPAELYTAGSAAFSRLLWLAGSAFSLAFGLALVPLLHRDRTSRFWAAGMALSLVPAASTYPQNRQLLFASFGAMALLAQLWQLHATASVGPVATRLQRFSDWCTRPVLVVHLLLSPVLQPLTTCGIAAAGALQRGAIRSIGDDFAGHDVVFITAPDYFSTKLPQLSRRIAGQPLPRRWRALSFGPEQVTVARPDDRTLELTYAGGILTHPFLELYRDRRIPMARGETVRLQGLDIKVVDVTEDGRLACAEFVFDTSVSASSFRFLAWEVDRFVPFVPPLIGKKKALGPARLKWGY
jgi:hypothetical protein